MRVLWFANTPSLYDTVVFGGGWIASLERILQTCEECQLGIAFEYNKCADVETRGQVTYFPMYEKRSRFRERYVDSYTFKYRDKFLLEAGMRIIADFKPDVIHVWGSEWCFGLLAEMTSIPVVIHMQGSWPVYKRVIESVKSTRTLWDYMHETHKPQLWWSFLRKQHLSEMRAVREEKILRINRYYMGRTRWDKAVVSLFNSKARYFHCDEALRKSFVTNVGDWQLKDDKRCILITVANTDMIKGYDFIFQTAQLLNQYAPFEFEWRLVGNGIDSLYLARRKTGIDYAQVGIVPYGQQPEGEVMKHLLESDIFVQTSYIDNSPNAVCEAQYVGLPIITTHVGGVPSLFENEYDAELFVPSHDPYYLASKIIALFEDKEKMQQLSVMNKSIARRRHNDKMILADLLQCYRSVIIEQKEP